MTPEEAFYSTEEKTKEILECYKDFLHKSIRHKRGNSNFVLEYVLTPKFYDYDAVFYLDGKKVLNVECKVRDSIAWNAYDTTKIPLRKHAVALFYFQTYNIQTVYLCLFKDYLCFLNLHTAPDSHSSMVARHDRGDDVAEYALYKIDKFKGIA